MRSSLRINQLSPLAKAGAHVLLAFSTLLCLLPMVLVLIVSLTSEQTLAVDGYSFFPRSWSFEAYTYAFTGGEAVLKAYLVTASVTLLGTALSLLITALFAYALSRKDFVHRRFFLGLAAFTMLFNGGLVPWYLVCTQFLGLRDSYWALIVPFLVNAYYLVIMKTFFQSGIPDSIVESARIDGAGEFRIFFQIVFPIATPAFATVGLFVALGYWNDWWLPLMFVENPDLVNLQFLLYKLQNNLNFLTSGMVRSADAASSLSRLPAESARMAMAVLAAGPVVFFFPFVQRYFVKGLTMGSVKE